MKKITRTFKTKRVTYVYYSNGELKEDTNFFILAGRNPLDKYIEQVTGDKVVEIKEVTEVYRQYEMSVEEFTSIAKLVKEEENTNESC